MAQQKKTDTFQIGDLEDLDEGERIFVEAILAGKSASDAYRAAFNTDHMQQNSIWTCASRLRNSDKVQSWLVAARMAHLGNARLTVDNHMQELERLRELAAATGNYGAAVQAEQLRGKVAGHYVDKVQDVTNMDPVQTLREIAKESPELAASLAAEHGIPWQVDEGATKH